MDVEGLRAQIPALRSTIYLNTGWSGPSPLPVQEAITRRLQREIDEGPTTRPVFEERQAIGKAARAAMARFINAEPEEIALCANTTTGLNIVLNGLHFSPGDDVVTCDMEHSSGIVPLYFLRERAGVEIKVVRLSAQDAQERIVDQFAAAMTAKTRLVLLSEISYSSGLRLPLKEITALAHARGAQVLVDGAQTAGHISLDMRELEMDYYAFPGHKWLLGPDGVGGLFVRGDLIEALEPSAMAGRAAREYDFEGKFVPEREKIQKFELSTSNGALWAGLTAAIEFQEGAGKDAIEERIRRHAGLAIQELSAIPNVRVVSPLEGAGICGLVCFSVEGIEPPEVTAQLWQRRSAVMRSVRETASTRLSLHFFNTEEEIRQVAAAVAELAAEGPRETSPSSRLSFDA